VEGRDLQKYNRLDNSTGAPGPIKLQQMPTDASHSAEGRGEYAHEYHVDKNDLLLTSAGKDGGVSRGFKNSQHCLSKSVPRNGHAASENIGGNVT